MSTREQCYAALLARLSTVTLDGTAVLVERRYLLPADANAQGTLLPRIAIVPESEHHNRQAPTYPVVRTLSAHAYLYAHVTQGEDAGATIHRFLAAVEAALVPSPSPAQPFPANGWGIDGVVEIAPLVDGSPLTAALVPLSLILT